MDNGKKVIARLWGRYVGGIPSRAPIVLGINGDSYRTVCIYLKKSSDEKDYFEAKGCHVYFISKLQFFRVFNFIALWKLVRILKKEKVDILHCHLHQATIYGTLAAKLAGVRVIVSHVHGVNRTRTWRRRLINRLVFPHINRIVTVGEATRLDVLKCNTSAGRDQVVSIGNSINYHTFADVDIPAEDAKARLGLDPGSVVFGNVGRLAPNKMQGSIIRCLKRIKENDIPNAKLVIVGTGRLLDELKETAGHLDLSDDVLFLGQRDDIPKILKALDVFVFPSLAEGLPRAMLEAMACGVPVVGSRAGGMPEILDGGKYGELIEKNDEEGLYCSMLKLATLGPEERSLLVENGKKRIRQHYTHDLVIKRLEEIYASEFTDSAGKEKSGKTSPAVKVVN